MDTDHLKADSTNWDIENTVFSFQVYVLQYHIKETQFLSFSTVLSLYTEKSAVAGKKRKIIRIGVAVIFKLKELYLEELVWDDESKC